MKLIKNLITILLSLLILISTFRVSLTFTYYYLDTANFIERFCENIDKPELKCNGKCHLKKVVQEETNDTQLPFTIKNIKEITLYIVTDEDFNLSKISIKKDSICSYQNHYFYINSFDFFHPPEA